MIHDPRKVAVRSRINLLFILGFLTILICPAISLLEDPAVSVARGLAENRVLMPRPPVWLLIRYPRLFVTCFKEYFEDQFHGRGRLVTLNSLVLYKVFGDSSNSYIIPGKHSTLFFAGDATTPRHEFGNEIMRFRRVHPMTDMELSRTTDLLEGRRKWAESMGARFLFVIAPDKSSIYPEHLPDRITRLPSESPTDQLISHLKKSSQIDVIDLRPSLKQARLDKGLVYWLRDTHWNHEGALVGYHVIANWLHERFPSIQPIGQDDLARVRARHQGDMTKMLNLNNILDEPYTSISLKTVRSKQIPAVFDPKAVFKPPFIPSAYRIEGAKLPKALVITTHSWAE